MSRSACLVQLFSVTPSSLMGIANTCCTRNRLQICPRGLNPGLIALGHFVHCSLAECIGHIQCKNDELIVAVEAIDDRVGGEK
ncbi:uncharacterized protein EV422DRAFT_359883 [Fimicolochytrium jonesii]|uniref:uncharacterized protein n=1 Tax=Fimicolochytrium jonesii TaxID=1396493 RepID=UPI0022FE4C12|nr:uncharacterized protein EV422DRAFT_359883 [Fimicolochytrium jonesii]KAI8823545.1 hypothetical protein EV422DRAFT_359883 [Fimicolochytrium jonesii]